MINFGCPSCGKNFQVVDEYSGRRTKCPECGQMLQVPGIHRPAAANPPQIAPPPLPSRVSSSAEFSEPSPQRNAAPIGETAPTIPTETRAVSRAKLFISLGAGAVVLVLGTIAVTLWASGIFSKAPSGQQAGSQLLNSDQRAARRGSTEAAVAVSGELFVTTTGGDVKKAAGLKLHMTPITRELRESIETTGSREREINAESAAAYNALNDKYMKGIDTSTDEGYAKYFERRRAMNKELDEYHAKQYEPQITPLRVGAERALRVGALERRLTARRISPLVGRRIHA